MGMSIDEIVAQGRVLRAAGDYRGEAILLEQASRGAGLTRLDRQYLQQLAWYAGCSARVDDARKARVSNGARSSV